MILSIILLATSLSIDALGVGISYGLREIKIPLIPKIIICIFSIIYSVFALFIGSSLSSVLTPFSSKMIGISILLLMGIWIILQSLLRKDNTPVAEAPVKVSDGTLIKIAIKSLGITIQVIKNPAKGDIDRSGTIDKREALLLGLALSVDAIGAGIGSALAGFQSMAMPLAVGLFQFTFLYAGTYLGKKFLMTGKINKKALSLMPGVILISLAFLKIC
ncbi:MAG: sporulation membrane protein YtaF [Clostridia bacterium]|nr:sporulation membrane protein YtaF [Clostridia bacterium]